MDSVLRTQTRFGQLALLLTTAAMLLTGLLRRDAYTARARRLLAHHHDVAVVMVEADRFKQINDQLGHAAGDTILRTIDLAQVG
ncbi:diguanylate cyclase domain-containing protein [Streptomyces sp. NPDC021100]|uniref:diguanylate cyclase n=1 Tax=Streptomyces sp. NPDC021100 TaxID=3365114 RepID=UPI0037928CBC